MYRFEEIDYSKIDREEFYSFKDKSIFTTIPWMNFIIEDNPGAQPIIIRITNYEKLIGYFSGMKLKKAGISIIGSPFRGWSTCFMGLDVDDEIDENELVSLYNELTSFLLKNYKCRYMSISERRLSVEKSQKYFRTSVASTFELNINKTDDELFKGFKRDCKYSIRQFERRGATLEIAEPNDEFAEEYYQQLIDVFDKQGMVPTYSVDKVKRLLRSLASENMVLCLRVNDLEGNSIASSIYPGFKKKFFFWGGASYRSGQHYRPNEYMIWTAIKYWRDRGAVLLDMVGIRDYKRKFGPDEIHYAIMEFARPGCLIWAKNIAEEFYFKSLKWRHKG